MRTCNDDPHQVKRLLRPDGLFEEVPLAIQMLDLIIKADYEELLSIAQKNNFNLNKYLIIYNKGDTIL